MSRRRQVLYVDAAEVERTAEGFAFSWQIVDVNSAWVERSTLASDQLAASGAPVRMSADALDALARELGRDPDSLPWCRARRLVECIAADDLDGALARIDTPVTIDGVHEPLLVLAIELGAWQVAGALVELGHPLEVRSGTSWEVCELTIASLDGSDGASAVLARLLARGAIEPTSSLLRHARAPRIVHALIDAGARPNEPAPPSPVLGELAEALPLAVAIVHRDDHGFDRFDVAAALVERGASCDARDARGRTAMTVAVRWGYDEPVQWLLRHGAKHEI